jgi:hypothetical protein
MILSFVQKCISELFASFVSLSQNELVPLRNSRVPRGLRAKRHHSFMCVCVCVCMCERAMVRYGPRSGMQIEYVWGEQHPK